MQQLLQKDLIVGFIVLLFVFAIHVREPLWASLGASPGLVPLSPISPSVPP